MVKDFLRKRVGAAPTQSYDAEGARIPGAGCSEGGNKVGSADRPHRCDHCLDHFSSVSACAGCKLERYCTRECQKAAWPKHKAECREQQARTKQAKQAKQAKNKAPPRPKLGEVTDID